MNEVKNVIKQLSRKYNKKEIIIFVMIEKCFKLNYDLDESKNIVIEFFRHEKNDL